MPALNPEVGTLALRNVSRLTIFSCTPLGPEVEWKTMILLITASVNGSECARALNSAANGKTEVVSDVRTAINHLRETEYSTVVIDESMTETPANQVDVLLKHLGTAVPVFVNMAISRKERVVRDVVTALRRVEQEKALAKRSVESELRNELKSDLTGILLSAQQAMSVALLPTAAEAKMKMVCELADRMKMRLSAAHGD